MRTCVTYTCICICMSVCVCRCVEDTPLPRRPCRLRARFCSCLFSTWCRRHPVPLRSVFKLCFFVVVAVRVLLIEASSGSLRIRLGVLLQMTEQNEVADTARPSMFRLSAQDKRFQQFGQRLRGCVRVTTAVGADGCLFLNVGHGGSHAFVVRRCRNVRDFSAA